MNGDGIKIAIGEMERALSRLEIAARESCDQIENAGEASPGDDHLRSEVQAVIGEIDRLLAAEEDSEDG